MNKLTLAATFVILGATSAMAADMPVKARPAAPPPVIAPTWTGFYVGGNAGYGWSESDANTNVALTGNYLLFCGVACATAVGTTASPALRPDAFVGGLQAGYNWQAAQWLFGLEADINSYRNRASSTVTQAYPGFPAILYTSTTNVATDWLFTGRARAGVVTGPALLYVTGGVALTDFRYAHAFADNQAGFFATEAARISETRVGWTVGAGVEAMIGSNWSLKAEYLYVDFGRVTVAGTLTTANPAFGNDTFNHSVELRSHIGRVGLNYHFNSPVVAKY